MLLTDTLNQWQGLLEREMRGEVLELDPGYAEFYEEWKKTKAEALPKLSAAERVQLLSDDIADEMQKRLERLISKRWGGSEKKEQLKTAAKHGDLCLVSTDEGKHFDKALSLPELMLLDPLKVRFFSPTLRSLTNNYEELKEEQNLLHVSKTLRANHCLVERGHVENHMVHVDIVHSRMQASEVQVDLQGENLWDYAFLAKDGTSNHVQETQLPEAFGVAEPKFSLEMLNPLKEAFLLDQNQTGLDEDLEASKTGALISFLANIETQRAGKQALENQSDLTPLNQSQQAPIGLEKNLQKTSQAQKIDLIAPLVDAASKFNAHVIDSKIDMANRIAATQAQNQAQQMNYAKRLQAYDAARRLMGMEKQENEKKRQEGFAMAQARRKLIAGLGTAVTGVAGSSFGFLSWWVTHGN